METGPHPEDHENDGHEIDPYTDAAIHVDVDTIIPTGICRYC